MVQFIRNLSLLTTIPKSYKISIQIIFDSTIITTFLVLLKSNHAEFDLIKDFFLIAMASFFFVLVMFMLNFYQNFVRFFTIRSMLKFFLLTAVLFISIAIIEMNNSKEIIIYFFVTFSFLILPRFILRELLNLGQSTGKSNIAVIGSEFDSYELFELLKTSKKFNPTYFLCNEHGNFHDRASRLEISISKFIKDSSKYQVDFIAIPEDLLNKPSTNKVIKSLEPLGIPFLKSEGIDKLFSSKENASNMVPLSLADLTLRDPQNPIEKLIMRNTFGKTILVTGGGGSIGSELSRQIFLENPKKIIIVDSCEYNLYQIEQNLHDLASNMATKTDFASVLCSVLDKNRMHEIFENNDFDVIFHAAAYKHVPLVEANPLVGFENNVLGTKILAELAIEFKIPSFTFVSTDKAVNPTNFMGVTKRIAEMFCQAFNDTQKITNFSIVRFGNVLSSSGSVIPKFEKQIVSGGPITVTHQDITRYFMSIPEASQLVIQASSMAKGGDVFVLDMGEPIKIMDLAKRLCSLRGLSSYCIAEGSFSGDIEIKVTGLRAAEKLFEELLLTDNATKTEHPRILSAQEKFIELKKLLVIVDSLHSTLTHRDGERFKAVMSQLTEINYCKTNMSDFCTKLQVKEHC